MEAPNCTDAYYFWSTTFLSHTSIWSIPLKPSCSFETWNNLVCSGLPELWLVQLQKASSIDNWPKEHHIPFTEKALADKSLLKGMPFCASPKTQSHFNAQDDIFQFKSVFFPPFNFYKLVLLHWTNFLRWAWKCMMRDFKNSYFKLSFKERSNSYSERKQKLRLKIKRARSPNSPKGFQQLFCLMGFPLTFGVPFDHLLTSFTCEEKFLSY